MLIHFQRFPWKKLDNSFLSEYVPTVLSLFPKWPCLKNFRHKPKEKNITTSITSTSEQGKTKTNLIYQRLNVSCAQKWFQRFRANNIRKCSIFWLSWRCFFKLRSLILALTISIVLILHEYNSNCPFFLRLKLSMWLCFFPLVYGENFLKLQ